MGIRDTGDLAQVKQDANLTTNTTTTPIEVFGLSNIGARGTFGGGALALQKSFTGSAAADDEWFTISISTDGTPSSWVSGFLLQMEEPERGVFYRWSLTGATAPDIDTHISSQVSATGR